MWLSQRSKDCGHFSVYQRAILSTSQLPKGHQTYGGYAHWKHHLPKEGAMSGWSKWLGLEVLRDDLLFSFHTTWRKAKIPISRPLKSPGAGLKKKKQRGQDLRCRMKHYDDYFLNGQFSGEVTPCIMRTLRGCLQQQPLSAPWSWNCWKRNVHPGSWLSLGIPGCKHTAWGIMSLRHGLGASVMAKPYKPSRVSRHCWVGWCPQGLRGFQNCEWEELKMAGWEQPRLTCCAGNSFMPWKN